MNFVTVVLGGIIVSPGGLSVVVAAVLADCPKTTVMGREDDNDMTNNRAINVLILSLSFLNDYCAFHALFAPTFKVHPCWSG